MELITRASTRRSAARAAIATVIGFAVFGAAPLISPAAADDAKAISGAQDTNRPGLIAEIIECKRQAGVLSIQMRLRNTTDKEVDAQIIDIRNFHQYYVTAGAKKYLIMEDSDRVPLSSQANSSGSFSARIPKGGSWVWWAKYTAPPADVKAISYYTPLAPPFDNVPISD